MSRIKNALARASEEINKFDRTKNPIHLEQAGEKIWMAFTLLVQQKFKRKIESFKELKKLVLTTGDQFLLDIFNDAYFLHRFFIKDLELRMILLLKEKRFSEL